MSEHKEFIGNHNDMALFEKILPEDSMFLIDERPRKDLAVVYRCRKDGQIEKAHITRRQPHAWKEEYQYSISGDYWGSLNGKLFDDLRELARALVKRGLIQIEF